ncbi:helix-turn-helix domain-containing protein [Pseudofrankia asymbiotica]|uniref:helix-turn-helix domain-containing protein n=1 Tax=Pseudofrankia asymbiotica TaxID=1834516 RepID=UPI001F522524|nr:helix-turn-helix transcriptional regulator [Pseudofrankia asymbiotica]
MIYAYRTHPYHGQTLPQELVGSWLGLTQPQLSRIENGRAPEELSKLIHYSDVLGIPADLLWFDRPGQPRQKASGDGSLAVDAVGPTPIKGGSTHETSRSGGLQDVVRGPADGDDMLADTRGLEAPRRPIVNGVSAQLFPAMDLDELPRISAALDDAHRYLDSKVVASVGRQLDRCKTDDGEAGPAQVLPTVLAVLKVVSQLARDVRPGIRRQLLTVGADSAEFAGWLYRDLHDPTSAVYWYDRAMEWAQEAQDCSMQAYVLVKKSQMAYDSRELVRMRTLAEAAAKVCPTPRMRVAVEQLQQEALALATHGEPLSMVERKLDAAWEAFSDGECAIDGARSPSSAATVRLRAAVTYTEAGHPARAAGIFADVLATGGLSRRDAGLFGARRAATLALCGRPDEAAAVGLDALAVARQTNSGRTVRVLSDVVRALGPWGFRPGPRDLREAMLA